MITFQDFYKFALLKIECKQLKFFLYLLYCEHISVCLKGTLCWSFFLFTFFGISRMHSNVRF